MFETLLVEDGCPERLAEHLERLARSVSELYGHALPGDLVERARVVAGTAARSRARLRLLADADGTVDVTVSDDLPDPEAPVTLIPFALPGGLGAHKWRDRDLIDGLAAAGAGRAPLFVDDDGLVLETATANVWVVEGGALLTPPADGRILPGVTRADVLATRSGAREEPITLERLRRAPAVFVSSSLGPWRPARS